MLSQISYCGSILSPSSQQVNEMEILINSFVTGKLKVSKDLISCEYSKGGLNMIDLRDFLSSLRCSWVKRSFSTQLIIGERI
jgi:hypothetical protein